MHSHILTSYRFLGGRPIALHCLVHFLNTTGPSLTKVVYAYFDRISYECSCRSGQNLAILDSQKLTIRYSGRAQSGQVSGFTPRPWLKDGENHETTESRGISETKSGCD